MLVNMTRLILIKQSVYVFSEWSHEKTAAYHDAKIISIIKISFLFKNHIIS